VVEYGQLGRSFQALREVGRSFASWNLEEARCHRDAPLPSPSIALSQRRLVLIDWVMARLLLPAVVGILFLGVLCPAPLKAEEPVLGGDVLFPELANPAKDARAAIRSHDFRFIAINRGMNIVPGVEDYPRTVRHHGTKFMKQPVHLFASPSRTFSYNLRVRAYAADYNKTLLQYLKQKKLEG